MKIKALIVDDEPLARDRLREMLGRESDIYHIDEAADGDEAVAKAVELKPDLMFLDVQMPKRDGFGVLKALDGGRLPVVIFTTAFDQHALAAFDAHAVDYVLKPYRPQRLHEAINRARELLAGRGSQEAMNRLLKLMAERETEVTPRLTRIPIRQESRTIFVKTEDIDWIEAAGNYMVVHTGTENHILRETMAALEQQLPAEKFLRVSRSAIINLERVRELQPLAAGEHAVVLRSGAVLEMTRGVREVEHFLKYH
jgi:two-component system LytT family response regulator